MLLSTLDCAGNLRKGSPKPPKRAAANAYTPCPVCVPARAAFATGKYVQIGTWDNAMA